MFPSYLLLPTMKQFHATLYLYISLEDYMRDIYLDVLIHECLKLLNVPKYA